MGPDRRFERPLGPTVVLTGELFRSQRGGVALDDRRGRLHGLDGPNALTRVHGHRLDVALDARQRQVIA